MSGFALANDVGWLTWDAGVLGGFPESLVDQGREALLDSPRGATPTGPWFETSTPEGAWIALVPLVPDAETAGAPTFVEQPDELSDDDGLQEGLLRESADISGAMIALYPSMAVAKELAVKGGEPAAQLHVTLKFLGPDASKISAKLLGQVRDAVKSFADACPVLSGHVSGTGEFEGKDDADTKPVFAKVEVPGIQEFRKKLVAALPDGVMADTYSEFKPHMTLDYVPKETEVDHSKREIPVEFDAIYVVVAEKKYRFPLLHGVSEAFEEELHPRGRSGQWVKKPFHELKVGDPIRHVESGARGTVQYMGSSRSWLTAKWDARANADLPSRFSGSSGSVEHAEPEVPAGRVGGGLSAAIKLPKSGKAKAVATHTVAVIDSLLDLPDLPPIVLKPTQKKGTRGGFERRKVEGTEPPEMEPVSIHLSSAESDVAPGADHLTMAHEIGHFLDNTVFVGDPDGRLGRAFESLQTGITKLSDEQWQSMDPITRQVYPQRPSVLDDWYEAVEASPTVTSGLREGVSFMDTDMVKYLINPKELLARSFAQWVAVRSGDPELMRGLDAWRNMPETRMEQRENWRGDMVAYPIQVPKWQRNRQWPDDEFEPIGKALDEAFEWMGILRKP